MTEKEIIDKYTLFTTDWYKICIYEPLSEEFIEKYQDNLDWENISIYQKLSEDFIRKHKDKLNWRNISSYQKLSEDFIREFSDKVNWDDLFFNCENNLTPSLIKDFGNRITYICK